MRRAALGALLVLVLLATPAQAHGIIGTWGARVQGTYAGPVFVTLSRHAGCEPPQIAWSWAVATDAHPQGESLGIAIVPVRATTNLFTSSHTFVVSGLDADTYTITLDVRIVCPSEVEHETKVWTQVG